MSTDAVTRWDRLTVAVVAKECVPGRVKTRLSPPLRPERAALLAAAALHQTLDTVRTLPVRGRVLFIDGSPDPADAAGMTVIPQPAGGLDERLAHLCAVVEGPLLILGMDTPQVGPADLEPVRIDWSRPSPVADAWFGPAADGGFWALALATPDPELLRGVPMSQTHTGAAQRDRLAAAGLRVGDLGVVRDVDVVDDAVEVALLCPGTPFARLCRQWGLSTGNAPATDVTGEAQPAGVRTSRAEGTR